MTRKVEKEMKPVLSMLGPRPGSEAVEAAKQAVVLIDRKLVVESAAQDLSVERTKEMQEAAAREKLPYLAVIQLETLHQSYENLLEESKEEQSSAEVVILELEKAMSEVASRKADHFEFSGRALKSLPRSLTGLSFLASLNLSSNHLDTLPDSIGNLSKLTVLNVSGNQLKALPENLGKCSKLEELNANFNQLESWPAVLGWKLKSLRKLELHFNNLIGLPDSVGHMKALQHLDLRNNRLCSLPTTIGLLTHLEFLDVSRNFNNLCSLPDSLGDLSALTVLDLSFNQIRELPASLGQVRSLERLLLEQNPLVVPPKRVVEHSQEAVLAFLRNLFENGGPATPKATSSPRKTTSACLMIPASPRHEHAGGWVPVRPGNTWMRSLLGQFVCGGGSCNVMGPGKTMRWQAYHSDDDDR